MILGRTNKPVPKWVKAAVLLLIAAALYSFTILPSAVKTVIAYERGNNAQREKRHITAIKEYETVMSRYPDFTPVIARLAISCYYSERIDECRQYLERIGQREVPEELKEEINGIVKGLNDMYFESNELSEALMLYGREEFEKTAEKLTAYLEKNSNDVLAMLHLANIYFDMEHYSEAAALYEKAIDIQPEFSTAYLNLSALYRKMGQLDIAAECCEKVLELNSEHPQAYVSLAKIEFARHRDSEGMEYAEKAYELDGEDLTVAANLCLAYHYNNLISDRDKLFEELKQKRYYDTATLQAVFEGTLELRHQ
jgi:tetratricopeptide (TPR) repeat protein